MNEKKTYRYKDVLYFIVSLLIAAGIWIYVDSVEGYKTTVSISDVPIEFTREDTLADRGLMLLEDSDTTVNLQLEGVRSTLMKLDPDKIRVQVDLSGITNTGSQRLTYSIIYPYGGNFSGLTNKGSFSVTVDVGELFRKNVESRYDISGNVADGYIAGELQFQPATLEIRGQQADIDRVSYARVEVNIDNATSTVTQTLDYKLYDENDQVVEDANIHSTVDQIQVTLPVNVIKELPLALSFIESPGSSLSNADYTITPEKITVSGDAELLKDIDQIVLDDFDLSELNSSATYYYNIPIPDGCENLSGTSRATLKISYKDMTSRTLEATHFQCENVPSGKVVSVLTSELSVTLRGKSADVAAVQPEDLVILADLKDVSSASGSYTVPAEVQIRSDGDVGVVGTYQIKITLSEEEHSQPAEDENNTPEG